MSDQIKTPSSASGLSWTSPSNIEGSSSFATFSVGESVSSQLLVGTNFGFSIPAGATINGIIASFNAEASVANFLTTEEIILVFGGSNVGSGKTSSTNYGTSASIQ